MAPEVFFSVCYAQNNPPKVIRDLHTFTPAILSDYCRHRVKYADYPAIVSEEGHTVLGVYATGLTEANMDKLDFFEGSEYSREKVTVKLQIRKGEKLVEEEKSTFAYVFLKPDFLEKREWDFEEFRNEKMRLWTRAGVTFDQDQGTC